MLTKLWFVPDKVWSACACRGHAQFGKGGNDLHLFLSKGLRNALRLPAVQRHTSRIEGGGHAHSSALLGPLPQKGHPSITQVLVTDARNLNAAHRYQSLSAVNPAQRDNDFHGLLHARAFAAGEHSPFLGCQLHWPTPIAQGMPRQAELDGTDGDWYVMWETGDTADGF